MMVHPGVKAATAQWDRRQFAAFQYFGKPAHASARLIRASMPWARVSDVQQHQHAAPTRNAGRTHPRHHHARRRRSQRSAQVRGGFHRARRRFGRLAGGGGEGGSLREAGALGAGAEVKIHHLEHYAHRIPNPTMARLFGENIASLGEDVQEPAPDERKGSATWAMSAISCPPFILCRDSRPGRGRAYARLRRRLPARAAIRRCCAAKAMAMTAVDLMTQPELVAKAKAELSAVANPGCEVAADALLHLGRARGATLEIAAVFALNSGVAPANCLCYTGVRLHLLQDNSSQRSKSQTVVTLPDRPKEKKLNGKCNV